MTDLALHGGRALVTGGAGFIGSHLVDSLTGTETVRVLDDFTAGRRSRVPEDVTVFEGDVRDHDLLARAMDGVDVVFHLAAEIDVERSIHDPERCHAVNVGGTLAVLERAKAIDAHVVFASSAAVYGDPEEVPVSELAPTRPNHPYGISKLAGEEYCRIYHELYGLDTTALRYFNVYGPRQSGNSYSGVIDTFLAEARNGEPITVHGDGEQTRDFVHVDDVVRANLLAAVNGGNGDVYNVGSGESVSVIELAELISSLTATESRIVHIEGRPGDVERSRADPSLAAEEIGFEPSVSLRAGLKGLVGASAGQA